MPWKTIDKTSEFHKKSLSRYQGTASSTIVLAGILAATLIAAQILVMARSGHRRAKNNATALIRKVVEDGLDAYITQSSKNYYLLEENNQIAGYAVIAMDVMEKDNDNNVFQGKELYKQLHDDTDLECTYLVNNDLSRFTYKLTSGNNRLQISQKKTDDDTWLVNYSNSYQVIPEFKFIQDSSNFIPSALLDFFSSLVGQAKNLNDGAAFSMVDLSLFEKTYILIDCWVTSGGDIPDEIQEKFPAGHCIQVKWSSNLIQTIYYDEDHQIIWQKNENNLTDLQMKRVTPQELIKIIPESKNRIKQWFQKNYSEDNRKTI
ncbi:MAG: hypothetical protein JW860_14755 [Sedimentisphaerales bacterium]|nr:hypothetical protein [Sedimentisphaerales bacterium]